MLEEVFSAAEFISRLVPSNCPLTLHQRESFKAALRELLFYKFEGHWDPTNPLLGNGYRSLLISGPLVDPLIVEASLRANAPDVIYYLPQDFTMWIDPNEVCCRFGERGTTSVIFNKPMPMAAPPHPSMMDYRSSPHFVSVK